MIGYRLQLIDSSHTPGNDNDVNVMCFFHFQHFLLESAPQVGGPQPILGRRPRFERAEEKS